jgi:hypothetical protein
LVTVISRSLWKQSVIVIIRLLFSVSVCPKVIITSSGFHCIWDSVCTSYCYLLYKDESMCLCVCVEKSHHPEIWHGLLILPGLSNKLGGNPECWPTGVPPIVTPSEKPWRIKNWAGASKQKMLLRVGLPCKILFVGVHPNLGPTQTWGPQGPPYQMGVNAFRIGRGPANKSWSSGRFVYKNFICGGLIPTQSLQDP